MIRVHIHEPSYDFGIDVIVADHQDGFIRVLHTDENGRHPRWETVSRDDQAVTADPVAPTFRLPAEAGRALLDALTRHYQGAEDTRQLRRDYDAERKRVDVQATVIADIAKSLAGRQAKT